MAHRTQHGLSYVMMKTAMYIETNVCVDCLQCMMAHWGTLTGLQKHQTSNSIEILCDYLERQGKKQNRLCELYLNCSQSVEKWTKIDKKYLWMQVTPFLDSIIAIIRARGGVTKLFGKNFFVLDVYT